MFDINGEYWRVLLVSPNHPQLIRPDGNAALGVCDDITKTIYINDEVNSSLYAEYKALADKEDNVIFGGRLAEYKYYDMAPIIEKVLETKF